MSVYDQVTVIGIEIDGEYRAFVQGSNLNDAANVLATADGLITFNGALFDLPFLARTFPGLKLPPVHVDLRFLARRAGLAGSLKTVETLAELRRAKDIRRHQRLRGDRSLERVRVRRTGSLAGAPRPVQCGRHAGPPALAELVVERMRDQLDQLRRAPIDGPTLFDPDSAQSACEGPGFIALPATRPSNLAERVRLLIAAA